MRGETCHWGVGWVRLAINALFGNITWLIEGGVGGWGLGGIGCSGGLGIFPCSKNTCLLIFS